MKLLLILILFIQICFTQSCISYRRDSLSNCQKLDNQRKDVLLYCKDSIQKQEMLQIIDSIMAIKCDDFLAYKRYIEDMKIIEK